MSHERGLEAAVNAYDNYIDHEGSSHYLALEAAIDAYLKARGMTTFGAVESRLEEHAARALKRHAFPREGD